MSNPRLKMCRVCKRLGYDDKFRGMVDVCETCSERICEVLNEVCPICGEEWLCVIDGTRHDYQNHDKQLDEM